MAATYRQQRRDTRSRVRTREGILLRDGLVAPSVRTRESEARSHNRCRDEYPHIAFQCFSNRGATRLALLRPYPSVHFGRMLVGRVARAASDRAARPAFGVPTTRCAI